MYKALLIDLDDTLYSYQDCHKIALQTVLETYNLTHQDYDRAYTEVKKHNTHTHDRLLYFSEMLNDKARDAVNLYWEKFYDNITPFPGVVRFIQWNIDHGIKICIVTNFDREIQQKKLEILGLDMLNMVSCSDTGVDKPHRLMFLEALHILKHPVEECLMIGDSHACDIIGACNVGITNNLQYGIDFCSWDALTDHYMDIYSDISTLCSLSRYYGERPDMVQGAGGNISVKLHNGDLAIKSSGNKLADMSIFGGYVILSHGVHKYKTGRPSIETAFHLKMPYKFVVHVHSVSVIMTPSTKFSSMFPDAQILPYLEPGTAIADNIELSKDIIYLQNHGIIVAGNDSVSVKAKLNTIHTKCAQNLGIETYDDLSYVSEQVRSIHPNYVTIETKLMTDNIKLHTPDIVVYINSGKITKYKERNYISATTLSQCYDIEQVLRVAIEIGGSHTPELKDVDIDKLVSRGDEHYRMRRSFT